MAANSQKKTNSANVMYSKYSYKVNSYINRYCWENKSYKQWEVNNFQWIQINSQIDCQHEWQLCTILDHIIFSSCLMEILCHGVGEGPACWTGPYSSKKIADIVLPILHKLSAYLHGYRLQNIRVSNEFFNIPFA